MKTPKPVVQGAPFGPTPPGVGLVPQSPAPAAGTGRVFLQAREKEE